MLGCSVTLLEGDPTAPFNCSLRSRTPDASTGDMKVVVDDKVGGSSWVISGEMDTLCRKIDRLIRPDRLVGRQALLATSQGAFQGRFKGARHPERKIEVIAVGTLEQIDTLEHDNVDTLKMVPMRVILACRFFREVCNYIMRALFLEWQYQLREHVVKTDGILIKMHGWPLRVKAFVWQVQPSVRIDADSFLALSLEQGNDLACEVPFAAAIDTTYPDQQAALRRHLLSLGKDLRYGLVHVNHRCVLVIGMEEMHPALPHLCR